MFKSIIILCFHLLIISLKAYTSNILFRKSFFSASEFKHIPYFLLYQIQGVRSSVEVLDPFRVVLEEQMRILFHSAGSNYSVWPEFKCSTPELGHRAFTIHHKLKSKNPIANIWSWLVNFHRCPQH